MHDDINIRNTCIFLRRHQVPLDFIEANDDDIALYYYMIALLEAQATY